MKVISVGRQELRWYRNEGIERQAAAPSDPELPLAASGARVAGLINPSSGSAGDGTSLLRELQTELETAGYEPELSLSAEHDLYQQFAERAGGADILLAAGGDGTILAAAKAALGADLPLLIVPAGTMNVAAKDLGLSPGCWTAQALAGARVRRVDLGLVNGEPFLNCIALGSFARITQAREELRGSEMNLSCWSNYCSELVRTTTGLGKRRLRWRRLGHRIWRKSGAIIIVNNPVSGDFPNFLERPRIDTGQLAVYELRSKNLLASLAREALRIGTGETPQEINVTHDEEYVLETREPTIQAVIDGEICTLKSPIEMKLAAGALQIVTP